jgi:hypothetical protein
MSLQFYLFRRSRKVSRDSGQSVSFREVRFILPCIRKIKTFKFKHDVKFNRADSLVPLVQSVLGVSLNCQKIEILADFYFGLQSRFASVSNVYS